jgi:thiol-disulfide isomerase/thioredoxin
MRQVNHRALFIQLLIFILVCSNYSLSQPPPKPIPVQKNISKEFYLGDIVPDIEFKLIDGKVVHLYDFENKLVLLDFWATWCGTCIANFPKLDSFQEKFGDRIQVLLVNTINTGDTEDKITDFLDKSKGKPWEIHNAKISINDSSAQQVFPHVSLPHYVWITKDHRIKAITSYKDVSLKNIESVLNGESIVLPVKKDFYSNKLIDFPETINGDLSLYRIFRKGRVEGMNPTLGTREEKIDENGNTIARGKIMINVSLLDMYKTTFLSNLSFSEKYTEKRLILDMKDFSELIFNPKQTDKESWEKQNLYYYDMVVPQKDAKKLYSIVLNDLNHYSGYYGRFENRKMKCLALIVKGNIEGIKAGKKNPDAGNDPEVMYVRDLPFSELVKIFDYSVKNTNLTIIDETGFKGNINLELKGNLRDIFALKKEISKYNLDIIEVERYIDVFVLSKR